MVLAVLSWTVQCLCQGSSSAAPVQHQCSSSAAGLFSRAVESVELCPREMESCEQKSLCAPLGVATRVLPETGTAQDTSLSQTCVLFSLQTIYTPHSCYFFPSYMNVSCPRCLPSSVSKPCHFLHVFGAPFLLGREHLL